MNNTDTKRGVLIIDGHIQALALTRSLGEKGIPVFIVDRNKHGVARYSKYCSKFFKCPDYLSPEFVPFLMKLGEVENLNNWLILPCDDHIVKTLSEHKKTLQEIYKIATVDERVLKNIINKRNLFDIASSIGLPVIKTIYPDDWVVHSQMLNSLRFPLLVKGIEGQTFYKKAQRKAFKVLDINELNQVLVNLSDALKLDEIMIQEMIPLSIDTKVISFTSFSVEGEIKAYWIGQKIREHPIYFGTATCSMSIHNEELPLLAKSILSSLAYDGVCEIEFLLDSRDGKYYIIEINPRTWLWVGLAKACGVDYANLLYNHANEIEQSYPNNYSENVYWKNEITDFIFSMMGIMQRKISFSKYLKTRKSKVKALSVKGDKKPFWAYLFLLPYIFFKR